MTLKLNIQQPTLNAQFPMEYRDIRLDIGHSLLDIGYSFSRTPNT